MALLARKPHSRLRTAVIAELCGVSEAHLAKVMQTLAKNGLVHGVRGPAGGVMLGRSSDAITLMDIWHAIEGNVEGDGCPFAIPTCNIGRCSLGRVFAQHNRDVENLMKKTALKDLDCGLKPGERC